MTRGPVRIFTGNGETHHHFLDLADQNAHRLLNVVDNILAISQLEAGQVRLRPTKSNLKSLIEAVVGANQHIARARGVDIKSTVNVIDVEATVDLEKLMHTLNILVDNAVQFSEKGHCVTISVDERANASYEFSVTDHGAGIAPRELPHIFDKFRQIDGSHTRSHQGLGLGLAIAKALVELHGATLSVESTVNEGSTFQFTIQSGSG